MQRSIGLIVISKKEEFVKNVLDFCDEHSIAAQSFSFVPAFNEPRALVLLDIDSIGEGAVSRIKNRVICLTTNFESIEFLKKLFKDGAFSVQSFRMEPITDSITKYYESVGA